MKQKFVPTESEKQLYKLHTKLLNYPDLVDEIRENFSDALIKNNIISRKEIDLLFQGKKSFSKKKQTRREFRKFLIFYLFALNFSDSEMDDYINLARKREQIRTLSRIINREGSTSEEIKKALRGFCNIPMGEVFIHQDEAIEIRVMLITHFISNQLPFVGIAKKYLTLRDIFEITEGTIGHPERPGKIGGKAAGMFLAHKIILPRLSKCDKELKEFVRIPESFCFTSAIFAEFLEYNNLYTFHSLKYKSQDEIEKEHSSVVDKILDSPFPPSIVEKFKIFLRKIGDCPIILRSSALLEDNKGFTFSGKYDSFFLCNYGNINRRLKEFILAFKKVHISTFNPAAIIYRQDHNLLDFDEKMSVLVQKVVGRRFGEFFYPFASGIAFSDNAFRWNPKMVKEDGLIRLVFGLGTRAVDRVGDDYPRMIPLSHPLMRPEVTASAIKKYSQKNMDVLNMKTGQKETINITAHLRENKHPDVYYAVSTDNEGHLSPPMFKKKIDNLDKSCITFDNLLIKTPFIRLMKKVLTGLEAAYGQAVDVEFAWDDEKLYLLQCRPLAFPEWEENEELPDKVGEKLFSHDNCITNRYIKKIEYFVYIDPREYTKISSMEERLEIAKIVGKINRSFKNKRFVLFGPERWGSSDINLGVKVCYNDINNTLVLGEIAFEKNEITPVVSYGTHFFNDLAEARIIPVALFPDNKGTMLNENFINSAKNALSSIDPELKRWEFVVKLIHIPSERGGRYLSIFQDDEKQKGFAFFEA